MENVALLRHQNEIVLMFSQNSYGITFKNFLVLFNTKIVAKLDHHFAQM